MPSSPFVKKKKPATTCTTAQRVYLWEHTKNHLCNVCGKRIWTISDMEIEHQKAKVKGGRKIKFAHRTCNRLKGSKSMKRIKRELAL